MSRRTFRIISFGGLGDILLGTPTFRALKNRYPGCRVIVFCRGRHDREVYQNNPNIDSIRTTSFVRNPVMFTCYYLRWAKFYLLDYPHYSPGIVFKKSATQIIAEMTGLSIEKAKPEVFLTPAEDAWGKMQLASFRNPVVIHITSLTSENQHWPMQNWEELIRTCPEYTFIQVGLSGEQPVAGAIDFRGTTTFRQAMAMIKNAVSFVGVVSAFAHATGAFDVPGVVLFGASTPDVWGHANNINLYKALRCAPCVDHLLKSPCPYGQPCMTGITVREVREALNSQVGPRIINA